MGRFQLLQSKNKSKLEDRKGIMLPFGFTPSFISILIEPSETCSRAVILLTSRSSGGLNYILCQLQVIDDREHASDINGLRILGTLSCVDTFHDNRLPKLTPSSCFSFRICGLILVGAGFQFDLVSTDDGTVQNDDDIIATLGILYNLGQSVASLEVSVTKKTFIQSVLNVEDASKMGSSIQVVEKTWESDIISRPSKCDKSTVDYFKNISFVVSSGGCFIWSVPLNMKGYEAYVKDPIVIGPVQLSPDDDLEKSKVFLGSMPSFSDQFLIYSSQERRKLQRKISSAHCQPLKAEEISIYGISDFIVGTPSFTPSLIQQLSKRSIDNRVGCCMLLLSRFLTKIYFRV